MVIEKWKVYEFKFIKVNDSMFGKYFWKGYFECYCNMKCIKIFLICNKIMVSG